MQASIIENRFIGIPMSESGEIGFKLSIIQVNNSGSERDLEIIPGPINNQGHKSFYALFTEREADFKILGTNIHRSRKANLKFKVHYDEPKSYTYHPGKAGLLETLDYYEDGRGIQKNLHFVSQRLRQGATYTDQYADRHGMSWDEASKAVPEIKVEFQRGMADDYDGQLKSDTSDMDKMFPLGSNGNIPDTHGAIIPNKTIVQKMGTTTFDPDTSFIVQPFIIYMCMDPASGQRDGRPTLYHDQ